MTRSTAASLPTRVIESQFSVADPVSLSLRRSTAAHASAARLRARTMLLISLLPGLAATVSGEEREAAALAPQIRREFRGAWVATVENIDWPSKPGLSAEAQQQELIDLLDRAREIGLNAVILQVRPACDALYRSSLEPWSPYLSGRMGTGPSPAYDPLEFAIREAHRRGLELHAWFNPFRAGLLESMSHIPPEHVSKSHPEWVRQYGKYLWLDPGEPQAVEHTLEVLLDVVRRYDLDGIHIDDYFYPYPVQDAAGKQIEFPDQETYRNRPAEERDFSRSDWRRRNVDRFVHKMYQQVKEVRPWVKVGISPFGIWRPGHPPSIRGFDAYDEIYADARLWWNQGWLDYLTPQLYWKIDSPAQSFPVLLAWWHQENTLGRQLWPGHYTSRLGDPAQGWNADEIINQVRATRAQQGATGNVHFSMKALVQDYGGIAGKLAQDLYRQPALVPPMPWLDHRKPAPPRIEPLPSARWNIEPQGDVPVRWWVLRERSSTGWTTRILSAEESRMHAATAAPDAEFPDRKLIINAVSRTGILSDDLPLLPAP